MINKWHSCLDDSGVVGTILMDLSKAFECPPHELILGKLHACGVDIKSLKLLQDYLSNQTQRVKPKGAPKGSMLGPLFFNIFVKGMLWFVEKTDNCKYTDDNTIYSCTRSVNDVIEKL